MGLSTPADTRRPEPSSGRVVNKLLARADGLHCRIILPEGADPRVLQAASEARARGIADPILVGEQVEIRAAAIALGLDLEDFELVEPASSPRLEGYAGRLSQTSGIPLRTSSLIARQPLHFAALALATGDADAMLAGAVYTSADVESVATSVIGLREGCIASSFFLMECPGRASEEDRILVFADPSVNPSPSPRELASIAVTTAESVRALLGWEPRVAMLSFSTKGSADHPDVRKVVEATGLAREIAVKRGIAIDGELQADAALVPSVARKKMTDLGEVAGRANVLVFPDLDAANIAYKLTQILGGGRAYGPILQGFRRPLSDLSRGATPEDILGAIAIVALLAEGLSA